MMHACLCVCAQAHEDRHENSGPRRAPDGGARRDDRDRDRDSRHEISGPRRAPEGGGGGARRDDPRDRDRDRDRDRAPAIADSRIRSRFVFMKLSFFFHHQFFFFFKIMNCNKKMSANSPGETRVDHRTAIVTTAPVDSK